jgi:hypothetical protein
MTDYPYELIHDAVIADDDEDQPPTQHDTHCELLRGYKHRHCTCTPDDDEPSTIGVDCA